MDVSLRGWSRDMGTKTLVSHDLKSFRISDDEKKSIRRSTPGLFRSYGDVSIAWCQTMKSMGEYRMQIDLSQSDIFKLMKASYGHELDVDLLENGFTLSEALRKKVLSEIKIADLTIGDLANLGAKSPASEAPTGSVSPLRRRL